MWSGEDGRSLAQRGVARRGPARHGIAWHGRGLKAPSTFRDLFMKKIKRQPKEIWVQTRLRVWTRDRGRCQGPYCKDAGPLELNSCHIDHIVEISCGGGNEDSNLRVLCRRCHVLRTSHKHQGMIAKALKDEIIPPDWRSLVWDG